MTPSDSIVYGWERVLQLSLALKHSVRGRMQLHLCVEVLEGRDKMASDASDSIVDRNRSMRLRLWNIAPPFDSPVPLSPLFLFVNLYKHQSINCLCIFNKAKLNVWAPENVPVGFLFSASRILFYCSYREQCFTTSGSDRRLFSFHFFSVMYFR